MSEKLWVAVVTGALAFASGVLVALITAWQQRRTALEQRLSELETAHRECQNTNDELRRRVGSLERALRASRS